MTDHRSPPLGVRYRRVLRHFQQADTPVRLLTIAVVAILLADLLGLGGIGGSKTTSTGTGGLASNSRPANAPGVGQPDTATNPSVTGPSGPLSTAPGATSGPGATPGTDQTGATFAPGGPAPSGSISKVPLTASDRGVSPTTIRVVFPWPNLGPIGQATGLDTSSEDNVRSITTFVNDINARGGINGRKIDPEIVSFNPLDDSDMRSKCIKWTQDEKVFAVVDSIAWHDDHQLCITQEGHTPLISGWSAVPLFTQEGNPNLWWTGPDEAAIVQNLVRWAVARHALTPQTKFGIVSADRQQDTISVNQYLLPALRQAGLQAADVEGMHFDSSDGLDSSIQAPGIVTRMRAKGVTTVIPMLPFLNLSAFMNEAKNQKWNPVELLSDYESGLTAGLGLADAGYANADNQVGPTSYVLGTHDDTRGYDPQGLDCYNVWMKANPGVTPPPAHWLEATGTAMTWCENIRLFSQAAALAGPSLTRAGFDAAMAKIDHFPGTVVPDLSFSSSRHAGPHQYRTIQIHENGDKKCPKKADGGDQGSCWLILSDWQEMQTG